MIALDLGFVALDWLTAWKGVDVLVSDLSMPSIDGLARIREIWKRRPQVPAVLLTGFAIHAAELAVNAELRGSVVLLRKLVDGQTLAERVAVLLEGQQSTARS